MKHILILLASLALFACGGGDTDRSAEDADDEAPANAIDDAADALHSAIEKAEGVENTIMESKEALDEAIEDATD